MPGHGALSPSPDAWMRSCAGPAQITTLRPATLPSEGLLAAARESPNLRNFALVATPSGTSGIADDRMFWAALSALCDQDVGLWPGHNNGTDWGGNQDTDR
jgi:hypothetical protein